MATHNQKPEKDQNIRGRIELEIDAKERIEWFKRYRPAHSSEEILMDVAKHLVQTEKENKRQETFLMATLGSALIGSIFLGIFSLVSREWSNVFWAIIIFVADVFVISKIYGKQNR